MREKCLCSLRSPTPSAYGEADKILLFPCSGGSNCGQLANTAAVRLTQEGVANMYCLAGIGGHVSGIVASTKSAGRVVGIDGCSIACVKKALEHVEIEPTDYIVVTDLGIEKNKNLDLPAPDILKVVSAVKDSLADNRSCC